MSETKSQTMASVNNCGVCARPLVYATESVTNTCTLCGKEEKTLIYCPARHYIFDSCHSKAAIEVLTVPSNVPHAVFTPQMPAKACDALSPVPQYLRGREEK